MDQEIFKNKILPLGAIVRARGGVKAEGFEDTEFRLHPIKKPCTDCDRMVANRVVTFEVKWGYKDIPHWIKRCSICKEKTALKSK